MPTGFMAAISKGQLGDELTEMAELAATGAAAFTDDGRPVVSAGLMRRALAVQRPHGAAVSRSTARSRRSRAAVMRTRASVAAELGLGPYPSTAESVMVERDLALAGAEDRPLHLMHLSARESVAALDHALAAGVRATGEVTPHHLVLTDEAVRSLDPNVEDEPAAALGGRPRGAARRAPARRDLVRRDRPRAARAPREGRAVRGGAVRRDRPRDGLRGAPHAPRRPRDRSSLETLLERMSAGPGASVRPRRAADRGRRAREPRRARPRRRVDGDRGRASARSPPTRGSSARRSGAASCTTVADGRVVFER